MSLEGFWGEPIGHVCCTICSLRFPRLLYSIAPELTAENEHASCRNPGNRG